MDAEPTKQRHYLQEEDRTESQRSSYHLRVMFTTVFTSLIVVRQFGEQMLMNSNLNASLAGNQDG